MRALIIGASLAFTASIASAQYLSTQPQFQPFQPQQQQVFPQSSYTYDRQSGNRYTTTTNPDGSAEVRGNNYQTGARWRTTIDADGQQRGTDADGNRWKYNPTTGRYYNYGTGQTCTGTGNRRTCY